MDHIDNHIIQFHLDDQPLDPFIKIDKAGIEDIPIGEQGVGLLIEHRYLLGDGIIAVFGFNHMMVVKPGTDCGGLAAIPGAVRTGIYLNQANDIGLDGTDKLDNPVQVLIRLLEKSGIGQGQVVVILMAGPVPNIIEEKFHGG